MNLRVGVALLAALFGCIGGCGGRVEGDDIEFAYTVENAPGGVFSFETDTVVDQDVSSHHGYLTSVTLDVVSPAGATLAFISHAEASAVVGTVTTELVTLTHVAHVSSVPLDIVYHGDLLPFFPDGHTIRVKWTGLVDPTFGPLPKGGITLRCHIGIRY
jgi:hypothetical protein